MQGKLAGSILVALSLTGCGMFGGDEILPGQRVGLRDGLASDTTAPAPVNRSAPISLPAQVNNAEWTHRAGSVTHTMTHPALRADVARVWTAKIGEGNDRRHRIDTDPVVMGGKIFTLDSRATVTATATNGGTVWSMDLTPAGENANDASGGGLAAVDGRVYATTGFGEVVALDATSGGVIWRQRLDASGTGAPTVSGGKVYLTSADNRAWAINAADGRVIWQAPGTPSTASMVGASGPAVSGGKVIFPLSTGEVIATLPEGGFKLWSSIVAGGRTGRVYAELTDISADPVVVGSTVYVGNQSGRLAALDLATGEAKWTAKEGAYSPVWVTGGSIFLVSDLGELVRLDATSGERIWGVQLPYYTTAKIRKQKAVHAHYGPVLAGGRLWVASDDGLLRSFDPVSGAQVARFEIPGGATANPVVAGGTLYIVGGDGQLHAYR